MLDDRGLLLLDMVDIWLCYLRMNNTTMGTSVTCGRHPLLGGHRVRNMYTHHLKHKNRKFELRQNCDFLFSIVFSKINITINLSLGLFVLYRDWTNIKQITVELLSNRFQITLKNLLKPRSYSEKPDRRYRKQFRVLLNLVLSTPQSCY